MKVKNVALIICLASLTMGPVAMAETSYENIFVTANIEDHFPEFLAMEITKDLKASVEDYNNHRKDPNFFLASIKDTAQAKFFSASLKKRGLPEIKQKMNSDLYMIEVGKTHLEFNANLFLAKKYYLNGVEKTLNDKDFVASTNHGPVKSFTSLLLLGKLVTAAMADDDDPDFKGSYSNLETTKILMASIIALDSSFKTRGILDKIPLMSDAADLNLKNLVKKIDSYQTQCETGLSNQDSMTKVASISADDYSSLGSYDRYKMLKSLQYTADPSYQSTLALVRKMASENANNDSYKRDKNLVGYMNIEKNESKCEPMLKNLVDESKNKANRLSAYLDGGNSANVAFENHPCTKIAKLKVCLSKFATQASQINDFVRRKKADAKDAGVDSYDVPKNYPSQTIGQ